MSAATVAPDRGQVADVRPRLSRRSDFVTLGVSLWLIVGLFVDGWAHNNLEGLETFFTPWHALFYSGFAACAGWIGYQVVRTQEAGWRGLAAVPVGYGLGLVGLVVFGLGGAGDLVWHQVFGIEQDLEALFSPTHLLLLTGMALIVTSPLRAAWTAADGDGRQLRTFMPALLSLTLLTALVSFFFMYLSAFIDTSPTMSAQNWQPEFGPYPGDQALLTSGIASVLVSNVILFVPVLYLLRRWQPPFGSVTIMFTVVAVMLQAVIAFELPWLIAPAVIGGLGADLLIRALRPAPERANSYRLFGLLAPAVLWSAYYATLGALDPIVWSPEMWSGMIVYAGLTGLALAQVMLPRIATPAPTAAP